MAIKRLPRWNITTMRKYRTSSPKIAPCLRGRALLPNSARETTPMTSRIIGYYLTSKGHCLSSLRLNKIKSQHMISMFTIWRATCTINFPHNTLICINKISSMDTLIKGLRHPNTMDKMTRNYFRISQINIMCRITPRPQKSLMILKFHSQGRITLLIVPKSARNITALKNSVNINKFSKYHRQRKAQILSQNFPTILTWMKDLRFFKQWKSLEKVYNRKFTLHLTNPVKMT
jgi:hypothetical protein